MTTPSLESIARVIVGLEDTLNRVRDMAARYEAWTAPDGSNMVNALDVVDDIRKALGEMADQDGAIEGDVP